MTIALSKEDRQQALAPIERYFRANIEESIGNVAAGGLLGFLRGIEENDALFERLRFNDVKSFGLNADRIFMTYLVEGKVRDGEPFSLRGIELVTVRDGRIAKKDAFWKQYRPEVVDEISVPWRARRSASPGYFAPTGTDIG